MPEPEPKKVFGDVDGDGRVTVTDITALIFIYINDYQDLQRGRQTEQSE